MVFYIFFTDIKKHWTILYRLVNVSLLLVNYYRTLLLYISFTLIYYICKTIKKTFSDKTNAEPLSVKRSADLFKTRVFRLLDVYNFFFFLINLFCRLLTRKTLIQGEEGISCHEWWEEREGERRMEKKPYVNLLFFFKIIL